MWWVNPTTQDTTSPTSRFDEGNILSPKPLLEVTQIVKHKKNIKDTFCWILGTVVPDRFTPVFLESVFRETKKRKSISTLNNYQRTIWFFGETRKTTLMIYKETRKVLPELYQNQRNQTYRKNLSLYY